MTFQTMVFNEAKASGRLAKGPIVRFFDGNVEHQRRAWIDSEDGQLYVVLNREAYKFRPYRDDIQVYDFVIGRI